MTATTTLISEFRPTILFLVKFVMIYFVSNLLYGAFITSYYPKPDPVTRLATYQTAMLLRLAGETIEIRDHDNKPTTYLFRDNKGVISVYEGCNGINTIIVFGSFLFAFGPVGRKTWWYFGAGILVIHLANLVRLILLSLVSLYLPQYFYMTHKYLFTASLYVIIFALWIIWTEYFALRAANEQH